MLLKCEGFPTLSTVVTTTPRALTLETGMYILYNYSKAPVTSFPRYTSDSTDSSALQPELM